MNTNPTSSKTWPREMRALDWPVGGVSYTYQHRGYVRPEKLAYWLQQTFGHDETNHRVFSGYIYVKAPRQPNEVSTHDSFIVLSNILRMYGTWNYG